LVKKLVICLYMDNITLILDENTNQTNEDVTQLEYWHINALLKDFEEIKIDKEKDSEVDDEIFVDMKHYDMNYNIKQLQVICEYYGLQKTNKMKKQELIDQIILYEHNYENIDLVMKRKELWYYIGELKNDKFMKKFVLW